MSTWKDGWWVDDEDNHISYDPRVTQIDGKNYVPLTADPRFPGSGTPQSYLSTPIYANALDKMPDAFKQGPDGQWYLSTEAQSLMSDVSGVRAENMANTPFRAFSQTIGPAMGLAAGLGALGVGTVGAGAVPYQSLWSSLAEHAAQAGGSFSDIASAFGGQGFPGVGSGDIPASYSRMLAEGGPTLNDASPAAAQTIATNEYGLPDFSGPNTNLMQGAVNMTGFLSPDTNPLTAGAAAGVAGISPYISAAAGAAPSGGALSSIANFLGLGSGPMSGLSALGAITSGIGGIGSALASNSAANTAANAANNATASQLGMFNTINNQQAPYRQAGYQSLGSILGGLGLGPSSGGVGRGQFTHQFDANDLKINLAPNYDFQLQQGLGAVRNQMNTTGGQYSGNTLKAINDYAQNFAGNAYQNAFNNYNANQTNIFNRLSNIAGLGQTANQAVGNAGAQISGGVANSQIAGGQAQAAGTIGAANALTGAANNAMGWYALPQILGGFSGGLNA